MSGSAKEEVTVEQFNSFLLDKLGKIRAPAIGESATASLYRWRNEREVGVTVLVVVEHDLGKCMSGRVVQLERSECRSNVLEEPRKGENRIMFGEGMNSPTTRAKKKVNFCKSY